MTQTRRKKSLFFSEMRGVTKIPQRNYMSERKITNERFFNRALHASQHNNNPEAVGMLLYGLIHFHYGVETNDSQSSIATGINFNPLELLHPIDILSLEQFHPGDEKLNKLFAQYPQKVGFVIRHFLAEAGENHLEKYYPIKSTEDDEKNLAIQNNRQSISQRLWAGIVLLIEWADGETKLLNHNERQSKLQRGETILRIFSIYLNVLKVYYKNHGVEETSHKFKDLLHTITIVKILEQVANHSQHTPDNCLIDFTELEGVTIEDLLTHLTPEYTRVFGRLAQPVGNSNLDGWEKDEDVQCVSEWSYLEAQLIRQILCLHSYNTRENCRDRWKI